MRLRNDWEIVKPVSVGNADDRRTFRTTERRVSLASLGGCVFEAVEAKAVKARETLGLVDRVDADRALGFLFQATEELLHLHVVWINQGGVSQDSRTQTPKDIQGSGYKVAKDWVG